jgi:hypothetical protein
MRDWTREQLAELDDIYGYVPPEKRACRHPKLRPIPPNLTRRLQRVATDAGAIGFAVDRRCPDCSSWVRVLDD